MTAPRNYSKTTTFTADGVLFDMDGTLTDSIAAVEAAWGTKAEELGLEPEAVIAATHGRRASDNLTELIPSLRKEDVNKEVEAFERSILEFADTPPTSRKNSISSVRSRTPSRSSSRASSRKPSMTTLSGLAPMTPVGDGSPANGTPTESRRASATAASGLAFTTTHQLGKTDVEAAVPDESPFEDDIDGDEEIIDMSVRILPGVKELINSLPKGKFAVATSGAKTYCHGCLERTNIQIPDVCVTADDPRLKRGKPFPDPFLLAASDLGIDPKRSVIFEDSPSGIKAAVAAGGTVVAVCTSHERHQIDKLGAHYVVHTMNQVRVEQAENGELVFTIEHD